MKTVGVCLTFHSFVGATFISFVGPTVFVSQQTKSVGVRGNYTSFVVAFLLFLQILAPKVLGGFKCWPEFVGPTKESKVGPTGQQCLLLGSQNL